MKTLCLLLATALFIAPSILRAAEGDNIKGLRLEPASTAVAVIGQARLIVEPLTRGEGGLHAPYRVEVQRLPTGGERGQFILVFSEANFTTLAHGQSLNFGGQAVSDDGNRSEVRGTVTPSSDDGGAIKIKVSSQKGKLVFNTTYRLLQ